MERENKDKKLDELISAAIGRDDVKFDFGKWKSEHGEEIREYESQDTKAGRQAGSGGLFRLIRFGSVLRYAAVAAIIAGIFISLPHFADGIAWADVAERFSSVPFFSASIYIKDDVTEEPKQVELWMSRGGKARMRTGTQVIFGYQGKVTKAYDIKTHSSKVEADSRAEFLLQKLGSTKEFSLDSVIKVVFGGKMEDVTPLINPDAVVSQDMVVFDIQSTISPEWLRIWALRQSRLPVRIKVWDPRDGEGTDVVFSYSRDQADEFFDPNAFEELLFSRRASSRVNLAYAYLKDPGGKQITPEDMFSDSGFHVPRVRHVGITPEGAVWVIADKGRNRTPEGRTFFGFAEIEDDLGREYYRVYSSHRTRTDQSMEAYVPLGYPFDANVPSKITLSCKMEKYEARGRDPLVGTVELTEWQQDKYWPKGTIDAAAQPFATTLAWRHANGKRYAEAERILATIEGEPGKDPGALTRERIRLSMLLKEEKYEEAVAFGKELIPAMEADYRKWKGYTPHVTNFTDYMVALACTKRIEEVKELWDRLKAIQPEIPKRLNKRAREHIAEDMERSFKNAARTVVPHLSEKARLTVEQIDEIFGIDIKNDEDLKHLGFWDWNPQYEKPRYKNWERRLGELGEYYKTHPLPERMEILKRNKNEEMGVRFTRMPGIETHYAEPLRKFRDYVYFYKYPESVGRVRMEDGLAELKLQYDIVYKKGIKQPEKIAFVLEHFGLEVVEANEPRRVWVAKYDGRKLKDFKEVKAPGKLMAMTSGGFDLDSLFRNFTDHQNRDVQAAGVIIIDETGVTEKVALECPDFEGAKGLETARKWFAQEMGVTFTEDVRAMTTYVIRKRQ